MGCCGGFIGEVFNPVVDVVEDIGGAVLDAGQDVIDVVDDAGHWIDDKVNEEIPGGWATVAAATGVYFAPEIAAAMGAEAGTAGAAAGAAEGATGLATLPESVLAADTAFATGSELAALPEISSSWGLSTAAPTAEFGTFNPSTISGIGADTSSLGSIEWLGGAGSLAEGTAGLTAEQISNAALAGSIGSNASSGLGYLGGAESLPSGTAGITGVTSTPITDSLTNIAKNASDLLGGNQQSGSNTAYMLAKGLSGGQESAPIGYNMNQSPFTFTAQQPIQGTYNPQTSPLNISDQTKNLAKLLRNS